MSELSLNAFEPTDSRLWIQKIHSELKGKPIEGLHWKIEEGITLVPYASPEASSSQHFPILKTTRSKTWETAGNVYYSNENSTNQDLLKLLQQGANSLNLYIKDYIDSINWEMLLQDIPFEDFFLYIHTSSQPLLDSFHAFVSSADKELNVYFSMALNALEKDSISMESTYLRPIVELDRSREISESVGQLLFDLTKGIQLWMAKGASMEAFAQKLIIRIPLDHQILAGIAMIRAIRIVVIQLFEAYGLREEDIHISYEGILLKQFDSEEQTHSLIHACSQAFTAISAGVDRIFADPSLVKSTIDQRLILNVLHLLRYESKMDWVEDPAAGSYGLELLTDNFASASWKQFQELFASNN